MNTFEIPGPTWTHSYAVERVRVRGLEFDLSASNERLKCWAEFFDNIEPELLDWIDGLDCGSTYFDLGASIGHFSIYAAMKRRTFVTCFEPEAQNFATLELNHFFNRRRLPHPLTAFNVALSNAKSIGSIVVGHYGAGEHQKSLSEFTRNAAKSRQPSHRQTVLCYPLDVLRKEFGLPQPQYVKVDVDGSELAVLEGARKTLHHRDCRELFIELDENDKNTRELKNLIADLGWKPLHKVPVKRGRGGCYEGLFNSIFTK